MIRMAHTPSSNPYSVVDESLREQVLSVQEQHVFSPRLVNTARVGFSRAELLLSWGRCLRTSTGCDADVHSGEAERERW